MQGWVGVFPLLTAALAATVPPAPDATWSPQDAVDFFNQRTNFAYLYRLEETDASDDVTRPGRMQFTVKETECLKSEARSIEDCKFKEGGVMKYCTALLPVDPKTDEIVMRCKSRISKRALRSVAWQWYCYRRGGCYSIIGYARPNDDNLLEPLFPALEPNLGGIASVDSDLDEKDVPHSHNIFVGDETKSLDSTNPFELGGAWHEEDAK